MLKAYLQINCGKQTKTNMKRTELSKPLLHIPGFRAPFLSEYFQRRIITTYEKKICFSVCGGFLMYSKLGNYREVEERKSVTCSSPM